MWLRSSVLWGWGKGGYRQAALKLGNIKLNPDLTSGQQ